MSTNLIAPIDELSAHTSAIDQTRAQLNVRIAGQGQAFPPTIVTHEGAMQTLEARGISRRVASRVASAARAEEVRSRRSCAPLEWHAEPHQFHERVALAESTGVQLSVEASSSAILDAGIDTREIGTLVFVSSTMLSMPSPDAYIVNQLAMRDDTVRVPMWGRGCAGGAAGLAVAAQLAESSTRPVLLVVTETCSLHGHAGDHSMLSVLITLLYGDGAAALVLMGPNCDPIAQRGLSPDGRILTIDGRPAPRIVGAKSTLVPDTSQLGGWDVDADGFRYRHLAEIAEVAATQVPVAVHEGAESFGFEHAFGSGELWAALHPTNAAVIEQQGKALGLHSSAIKINLESLAQHGNTSAPSVLFALREILEEAPTGSPVLALATGPGYSIEQVWIQR